LGVSAEPEKDEGKAIEEEFEEDNEEEDDDDDEEEEDDDDDGLGNAGGFPREGIVEDEVVDDEEEAIGVAGPVPEELFGNTGGFGFGLGLNESVPGLELILSGGGLGPTGDLGSFEGLEFGGSL